MNNIGIGTMRFLGMLSLISGYLIAAKKINVPSDIFFYAIITADVMVVAFWILDEINGFKSRNKK
ncbi:TPA: hypothetical protein KRU84_001972 [Escherichia coli]|jgi:hypothetical protein|uniref:hypothetical protein n=1 Tax=Escherichia coli TaxID=562 RepID=UPI000944F0DA|nr:hypothetical protein [Escherichia coli]OKV07757.1 hypothetical protein AWP52_21020 [Escherichia coli]OKW05917.1 hypothetical protein AWP65_08150 [Escherichia coli]TFA49659.1 hypothetical protein BON92_19200 [Escherichia coli]HBG9463600.1 hypothetical protein [Escherichia coli]HDU8390384.1 hypothetical protein [Escherichia coli]